ncbi:alpha/beta hydrolase domain-containing protein [Vineibacter terrae]|uniref:alpha/beta hydrolase domain-containing protein n=1 Tax=Vineibacter terrae TaxID=2586908 RepID=UPI002E2F8C3F|nr:alpha/beta hydrolase domain-containing protein [Vineibacter terrae]HEX2885224.1 alpha/beta hydrolase domain-containing protein [Vineibacter terrae]
MGWPRAVLAGMLGASLAVAPAAAVITEIEILRSEPLAGGAAFGDTGGYVRLVGIARGEVDPLDPANRGIANIDKAPRNARGNVAYQTDIFILRPADPAKGNGRILYEVNNRGRKMLFGTLMDGAAGNNNPDTPAELGNALPLRLGFTLVWSGWDPDAPRANGGLALDAPVAAEGGQPIVAVIRDELVSGTRGAPVDTLRLSHQAASLDPAQAQLTVRQRQAEPRQAVPPAGWAFVDARSIRLLPAGSTPAPGALYELRYKATNARVMGLGFAATRDVVSFLRHDPAALALTGRQMTHALAIGISQSGRYLRDHISQGFNRDEQRRRVFDGVLSHIAGVGRVFFNAPFAQPFRTGTQHEDHDYPENAFPFSAATLTDPITETTGALLRDDGFDPLLIETNTSTEYWQKGASLLHTDPMGTRDVALPATARVYLIAGTQHGGRAGLASDRGPAVNPRNPHNPMPALRALLVALDAWVVTGRLPPPSRVPTIAAGTLVAAEAIGFPDIAGVAVARAANTVRPPGDWVDPQSAADAYRVLVPKVDSDGNEVGGIRLPDIAVPLGTYTGWNLYKAPYPEGELADRDGSFIAFAATKAERDSSGDPRPAIAERYRDRAAYVAKVEQVVAALVRDRLLLDEDAAAYIARAKAEARVAPGP